MRRVIQGVTFDIASPSCYVVAADAYDSHHRSADVCYVGGDCWILTVIDCNGQPVQRTFASRDQAISVIAIAFKNVGLIA